jgi:hypothetical protein
MDGVVCQPLLINYVMVFCPMLFKRFIANQQGFVPIIPKVFAKQMENRSGIVPHDFINDDVSRQSPSFHSNLSFVLSDYSIAEPKQFVKSFLKKMMEFSPHQTACHRL